MSQTQSQAQVTTPPKPKPKPTLTASRKSPEKALADALEESAEPIGPADSAKSAGPPDPNIKHPPHTGESACLDYDSLHKGMTITRERCEDIIGVSHTHRMYAFGLMQLSGKIAKEMRDRGKHATVKTHNGEVIICDDSEAAEYNRRAFKLGGRKLRRAHSRNMAVDVSKLTPDERKMHERTLLTQGALLCAMRERSKQLKLGAAVRKTPAIAGKIGVEKGEGNEEGKGGENGEAKKE